MTLVGLTGGIGSGKSTVAARFAERGAIVIDADAIAREVVAAGEPTLAALVDAFGPQILTDEGELDRPGLARIVFADEDQRRRLEAITHPAIDARLVQRQQEALRQEPSRLVVVDHPLLIETGRYAAFRVLIVVIAPESLRVERLVTGRGMDRSDVLRRIAAQTDDDTRRRLATHVIENDAGVATLRSRADGVFDALTSSD